MAESREIFGHPTVSPSLRHLSLSLTHSPSLALFVSPLPFPSHSYTSATPPQIMLPPASAPPPNPPHTH
jgi:hypothetical protein